MTEMEILEDMEKELLVDKYVLDYEGVFDYDGLIRLIDRWCEDNGFYRDIDSHKEKVTAEGRNISIGYTLQRKFDKRHFTVICMDLSIEGMKDVEVELDGKKRRMLNRGTVEVTFHGYLMTSEKSRWETKGYAYFIRGVIDKFIYKIDRPEYRGIASSDAFKLINEIRGFLNIHSNIGEGGPVKGRMKGGWK